MNIYHDILDRLGGPPYETASEDEVVRFARKRGFIVERILVVPGGCSKYVFSTPRGECEDLARLPGVSRNLVREVVVNAAGDASTRS